MDEARFLFAAAGVVTLVVTMWKTGTDLETLVLTFFPTARGLVLLGISIVVGIVLGGSVGLGVLAFATTFVLWREERENDARAAELVVRRERRRAHGVHASAVVKAIERTGLSVDGQPQVELTLDTELPDGRRVKLLERRIVDVLDIPRVQPGRTVDVLVDPEDTSNFEVSWEDDPE